MVLVLKRHVLIPKMVLELGTPEQIGNKDANGSHMCLSQIGALSPEIISTVPVGDLIPCSKLNIQPPFLNAHM